MGIFDDAIREHLELKRHAGADEDELRELEDEAFGPPARPGEPDFPGSTGEDEAGEAPAEAPAATSALFDAEAEDAAPAPAPAPAPGEATAEAPAAEEPVLTPLDEAAGAGSESAAEAEAREPGAVEESPELEAPELEAPEVETPSGGSSFTTEEREAIADQPTVFFEQQEPAELELGDLDLDLDEEIEEVGGAVSEPLPGEEPPIVEEAFADDEVVAEAEVAEPPHTIEPEPAPASEVEEAGAGEEERPATGEEEEPAPSDSEAPEDAAEAGTGEEDVLEETPEFLRDNPGDDELWFEQGEPKDFDF